VVVAVQCLLAVFLGSEIIVQWVQLAVALYSLHLMASTEEWVRPRSQPHSPVHLSC
jgi:hypothetical protein